MIENPMNEIELNTAFSSDDIEEQSLINNLPVNLLCNEGKIQASEDIQRIVTSQRNAAVVTYIVFLIFSPLAFRYLMTSSDITTVNSSSQQYNVGNATITATTSWSSCTNCDFYNGFTLKELIIEVYNVTSPNLSGGFPSIAIFASHDLVNWFNFYNPNGNVSSEPYLKSWDYTKFTLNQALGLDCLGNVENSYLAICLNVYDLANSVGSGKSVGGPPFNNRCFQVYGICGAPCFDFSIVNGTISFPGQDSVNWAKGGNPSTIQVKRDITSTGRAAIVTATPIVVIMISSDYIILNERRSIGQSQDKVDEEYNRIRLWWAWINFIRSLSQLPPDPSKINAITPDINSNIAISGKPNSNSKGNYKIKVAKGYSASFNVSANHSTFEGISLHSYSESVPLDNDD
eukprot:gene21863-28302_t